MRNVWFFWLVLIATTLLVFQVDLTLSAVPFSARGDYDGIVTFTGTDSFTVVETASHMKYNWEVLEGDPSTITSFAIDAKNLKAHPECSIVENCKFFPYPEASCDGKTGKICNEKNLKLTQPDRILLAVVKSRFDGVTVRLRIKAVFNNNTGPTPSPGGSKTSSGTGPNLLTPNLTPTVTPHPANLLSGDITSDGYANCGTVRFNDFRVWYSKEQNSIEFYAEGVGTLDSQAQFIVYFDANHIVYERVTMQVNGSFNFRQGFSTEFDDAFPDLFFNIPGTGAYAILTVDQGCVTAPVGSQKTAYSNTITGISIFIALAFLPLAASLLFLKRDVNYSIYPDKWVTVAGSTNAANRDTIQNIPTSATSAAAIASHKSALTQTPSIYDLISFAQWIVTTALLTLPNLPVGYRQFASNFGWSTGTGGGINVQAFSDAADNLRMLVCPLLPAICNSSLQQFDTCKPWFNSDVTPNYLFTANITNGDKTYFKDPTGFDSYSNTLHIPNNNVFFVMFVALLLAIGSVLIIMLLVGAVASKMKEKVKKLEKVSQNMRLLVFGALLRVIVTMYYPVTLFSLYQLTQTSDCWLLLLLASIVLTATSVGLLPFCIHKILSTFKTDKDLLWNKTNKVLYGVLYTDYLKDHVWFVIPIMVYQFLRSVVIAFGQHNGVAQITLLIILELVHLIAIYYYKPFERNLANIFNITLSSGRLIVIFLLVPFLGGNITITPTTRFSLAIVLIVLQLVIMVCVGGLIFLNITYAAFKFLSSKFGKEKNGNTEKGTKSNQADDDDNLTI